MSKKLQKTRFLFYKLYKVLSSQFVAQQFKKNKKIPENFSGIDCYMLKYWFN